MNCYRCGADDHYRRDCPTASDPPAAPPVPTARAEDYRRPASEIADAEAWAARIRAQMGWSAEWLEALRLERAREQLARSRTCLDGIFRDNVEL